MKFHNELNPLLWTDKKLNNDVREHLLELTDAFIEYMEIPEDSIIDILLLGSEASYNYTDKSDLDVHIKVDYDKIHKDCPIVEGYLWALKSLFNSQHDITIHNIPVEVYAESSNSETTSNGIYSIQKNKWIKEPEKIPPTDNDTAVEVKTKEIEDIADNVLDTDEAEELLNKIYEMRQSGLEEEGEFSTENLTFKKLRDNGVLDKLKQIKIDDFDERISLEQEIFEDNNILLSNDIDKYLDGTYDWEDNPDNVDFDFTVPKISKIDNQINYLSQNFYIEHNGDYDDETFTFKKGFIININVTNIKNIINLLYDLFLRLIANVKSSNIIIRY